MNTASYRIELLTKMHNRKDFACGSAPLDAYFQRQVSQDMRRHFGKCFCAIDTDTEEIAGFYTMSASNLTLPEMDLPDKAIKKTAALSCCTRCPDWSARCKPERSRARIGIIPYYQCNEPYCPKRYRGLRNYG